MANRRPESEREFNAARGCSCYRGEREECPLHGEPAPEQFDPRDAAEPHSVFDLDDEGVGL